MIGEVYRGVCIGGESEGEVKISRSPHLICRKKNEMKMIYAPLSPTLEVDHYRFEHVYHHDGKDKSGIWVHESIPRAEVFPFLLHRFMEMAKTLRDEGLLVRVLSEIYHKSR